MIVHSDHRSNAEKPNVYNCAPHCIVEEAVVTHVTESYCTWVLKIVMNGAAAR